MKKVVCFVAFLLLWVTAVWAEQQRYSQPANPEMGENARNLLHYLQSLPGKGILSGQEETPDLNKHMEKVLARTGKLPALRGWDVRFDVNDPMPEAAYSWYKRNQIVTFTWHMGSPPLPDSYQNSKKQCNVRRCITPGTAEYESFIGKLDRMADRLQKLCDRQVPVLWRPFHEMNGSWFWWSKNGPDAFRELWIFVFEYFTRTKKLNNLIWVWSASFEPSGRWYPGDQYVDIVGTDTYFSKPDHQRWQRIYERLRKIAPTKPTAITENDLIADPAVLDDRDIDYVWFLTWHSSWLDKNTASHLHYIYNNQYVITIDELPNLKSQDRR